MGRNWRVLGIFVLSALIAGGHYAAAVCDYSKVGRPKRVDDKAAIARAAAKIEADNILLSFGYDLGYYISKYVRTPALDNFLAGLVSPDRAVRLAAVKKWEEMFANVEYHGRYPFRQLPPDVASEVKDHKLWEHLRYRATSADNTRYFGDEKELETAREAIVTAWSYGTPDLKLHGLPRDGVAPYVYKRGDVEYGVAICVELSAKCPKLGQVKDLHPRCGPTVKAIDYQRLRSMLPQIAEAAREPAGFIQPVWLINKPCQAQ